MELPVRTFTWTTKYPWEFQSMPGYYECLRDTCNRLSIDMECKLLKIRLNAGLTKVDCCIVSPKFEFEIHSQLIINLYIQFII